MKFFKTMMLFLILVFFACQNKYYYEQFESLPSKKWFYKDTLNFKVEIADTSALYNIYVLPRHTVEFPYMNFWVKIKTTYPNMDEREQRIEIPMADKTGKWFGKGVGALKLNEVSIIQNVKLLQKGYYNFKIVQDMRYQPVKTIRDFGFRIEKMELKN